MVYQRLLLEQLIEGNYDLLYDSEVLAMTTVESILCEQYNMQMEYAKPPTERNVQIRNIVAVLTVYDLMSRLHPTTVSDVWRQKYQNTMLILDQMMAGKVKPNLPPAQNDRLENQGRIIARHFGQDVDMTR